MEWDVVVARELDTAQRQDLAARAGHFEHLVEVDAGELARLRNDPRVGGEDSGDIGVDLARVGVECLRQRGRGQVARIEQGPGSGNVGSILQDVGATNATAVIRQTGSNNSYSIAQTAAGQYIVVSQTGNGNAVTNVVQRP